MSFRFVILGFLLGIVFSFGTQHPGVCGELDDDSSAVISTEVVRGLGLTSWEYTVIFFPFFFEGGKDRQRREKEKRKKIYWKKREEKRRDPVSRKKETQRAKARKKKFNSSFPFCLFVFSRLLEENIIHCGLKFVNQISQIDCLSLSLLVFLVIFPPSPSSDSGL